MEKLPQIAVEIAEEIFKTLKEKGYEIGFGDRGHTIENGGGYITFSSFLELIDSIQEEDEFEEFID